MSPEPSPNLPPLLDREIFDVCIVGSGAAGGIAAKELTALGLRVAVLERGNWVSPTRFRTHVPPYQLPYRGFREGHGSDEYTGFLHAPHPSTSDPAGEEIDYALLPAVGGKTLLWDAFSWRFGERDLQGRTAGDDWPIRYQDLAPFYDRAERFMGVAGSREGLAAVPDGIFLKPLPLRCGERIIQKACLKKLGPQYRMFPVRKAINTEPRGGRPVCHYCGHCMRGCDVDAKYTSANSPIPAALRTGRLTLATGAVVHALELDETGGRVRAAHFLDARTRQEHRARARAFALACGGVEDARILLMSKSSRFPQGLANSSGWVGKNLLSGMGVGIFGYLESMVGGPVVNDAGTGTHGAIANLYYEKNSPHFARGYGVYVGAGRPQIPGLLRTLRGMGRDFKKRAREIYPALVYVGGAGEILAHPDNYVDLDPHQKDEYGLPLPRFHFRFHENELAMAKDIIEKCQTILEASGGVRLAAREIPRPEFDGENLVGLARMGDDSRTSAVNRWNRAHDVKNLWILDGASFTSYAEKNPTLTVIAVAMRAAQHLAESLRKGET
jgi:choline dehydrogenase-like flavoprotein